MSLGKVVCMGEGRWGGGVGSLMVRRGCFENRNLKAVGSTKNPNYSFLEVHIKKKENGGGGRYSFLRTVVVNA